MNNLFRKHANNLFASRGCDVDLALSYAQETINSMPEEHRAGFWTALMVVVNTAANAFDQAQGPSPEKLALIELIDSRIKASAADIDQKISDWFDSNVDIEDRINSWMSDNFDVTDYNVDAIDIDEKVSDWMSEHLETYIENMDLVVRVR